MKARGVSTGLRAMSEIDAIDFQPIGRTLFGPGRIEETGEVSSGLGFRRTLVVTDSGIVRAGHVDSVMTALSGVGIEPFVFDGVEENPTTVHVGKALEVARAHRVDSIVGVGGGSSLDCAKGVNFLFSNGGEMRDYWGVGKAAREMLPSLGIPTTAGTGSETQSFALISDPVTRQKMACGDRKAAFRAIILDPRVTESMPPEVLAATGMDAISHAVESFVTTRRNPISTAFSREAWKLLSGNFLTVVDAAGQAEESSRAGRAAMLLGASLSGMAIENSMLGAAHALANPLTAHFGIVHGVAIGLMLPHVVRYNGVVCESNYRELAAVSSMNHVESPGAREIVARIELFRQRARLPDRLSSLGVTEESLPELAGEAASQWTARFNPRPAIATEMEELYRCAF